MIPRHNKQKAPGATNTEGFQNVTHKRRHFSKSTATEAQYRRIIDALRRRPHTSYELMTIAGVYHPPSRIFELKAKGFIIDKTSVTVVDRDGYRRDYWQDQPVRVEVWSEKGTVRGTLAPVLNEYGVTFRVLHGFGSATALNAIAEASNASDKPLFALYLGDRDPSGMFMSEADIPQRLARYGGAVNLQRIALLASDTQGLPSFDVETKSKDGRYEWFCERYGRRCWELDAMPPPLLRARVEAEIRRHIVLDRWEHAVDAPPVPATGNYNAETSVTRAAQALREHGPRALEIRQSSDWTEAGRRKAAAPDALACFWKIASSYSAAADALAAANQRENRLLAVPSPDLRLPGAAIRQWEARSFFRDLDKAGKLQFLAKVQQGHHAAEEVLSALMTGPLAQLDSDVEAVRLAWETHRRESNPTEVEAIESDRQSGRWAMSSIAVIGVAAREAFQGLAEPLEVLARNAKGELPEGFEAFGIKPEAMRRAVSLDALKA